MRVSQLARRWNLPPWEVERMASDPTMTRWFLAEKAIEEFESAIVRGAGG